MNKHDWVVLTSVLLGLGCAAAPSTVVVNGVPMQRPTAEYTGRPFTVRHQGAHPQPGGPSSGLRSDGGRITGQVCGMDIEYVVEHRGDHVQLTGFLDMNLPSQIQVRDQAGLRVFNGNLGNAAAVLHVRGGELVGLSGFRRVHLLQQEDRLVGHMLPFNTNKPVEVTLDGRSALWGMPAAVQAAVLPGLLTCFSARIGFFGRSPLVLAIGGSAGALPRQSSSLYQP